MFFGLYDIEIFDMTSSHPQMVNTRTETIDAKIKKFKMT
jgi:hypothetical protein